MTLPVPNLDDRNFDQLVTEARALIPKFYPEWTDYNPSDPGIALLELFAFMMEVSIYQINRIPEKTLENFAVLLGVKRNGNENIQQTLRRGLEGLKDITRSVTYEDYEHILKNSVGFYNTTVPLRRDHQEGTAVQLMNAERIPLVIGRKSYAGSNVLNVKTRRNVELVRGDILLISNGKKSECILVDRVDINIESLSIITASPMTYDHINGIALKRLSVSEGVFHTRLVAKARKGEQIVTLEQNDKLSNDLIIKIDDSENAEYLYAISQNIVRVRSEVFQKNTELYGLEVKVVIIPAINNDMFPEPTELLLQKTYDVLRQFSPVTSRFLIVKPKYEDVCIGVTVVREKTSTLSMGTLKERVYNAIMGFFSPVPVDLNKTGWPFGRPVLRSELYMLLESIEGVDHVSELFIKAGSDSLKFSDSEKTVNKIGLYSSFSLVRLLEGSLAIDVADE